MSTDKRRFQKGSSTSEGLWILTVLLIIFFFFILPDNSPRTSSTPSTYGQDTSSSIQSGGQNTTGANLYTNPNSSYAKHISLSKGNASYADQSYEEYVTIHNNGSAPIDITGWQLANAKGQRSYDYGGMLRRFPSDSISIPKASLYINPFGFSPVQDVIIQRGETAVITTGSVGASTPYKITSFKENICTGYLEEMPEYSFTPQLSRDCPIPDEEPGLENYGKECKDFVNNLSSCQTPDFQEKDKQGEVCHNCVNGVRLSSSCVAFIKERFNYAGCIAHHSSDPDFYGRAWRVFIGRGWQMWAEDDETISLFDRLGNLVDSISY